MSTARYITWTRLLKFKSSFNSQTIGNSSHWTITAEDRKIIVTIIDSVFLISIKGPGDISAVCLLENYVKSDLYIHGNVYGPAYGKTHLIHVYLYGN